MRVLVTGGTGFLGREVLCRLDAAGIDVVNLSRRAAYDPRFGHVEPYAGSILSIEDCREAAEDCEVLIHLAGRVSRRRRDAADVMRLHVDGTRTVLQAAADAGVSRIIYLSTSGTIAVSEDPEEVKDERAAYPIEVVRQWPYYLSKIYAEQEALGFAERHDLPLICLNPTLMLGPGDFDHSSTNDIRRFLKGLVPVIPKGGMSFVDVRDVADVILNALDRGEGGERYLLGAENLSTEAFFRRIARMSGRPAPPIRLPARLTRWSSRLLASLETLGGTDLPINDIDLDMGRHGWYLDATKARKVLGFSPRPPNDTLRETVEDILRDEAAEED